MTIEHLYRPRTLLQHVNDAVLSFCFLLTKHIAVYFKLKTLVKFLVAVCAVLHFCAVLAFKFIAQVSFLVHLCICIVLF